MSKNSSQKRPRKDNQRDLGHISPPLRRFAVPLRLLVCDEANVRAHPERNLEAIAASLRRFGQQVPVVFAIRGRRNVVIKGNGLLAAARKLGWKFLAAAASDLEGSEARAYAIADNRTSDLSEFDQALLAAQLQELEEAEVDLEAMGFTEEELSELVEAVEDPRGLPSENTAGGSRKRGERTALFLVGHLKFEIPRKAFDRWISSVEGKIGNDPDRVVAEIKRRLRLIEP